MSTNTLNVSPVHYRLPTLPITQGIDTPALWMDTCGARMIRQFSSLCTFWGQPGLKPESAKFQGP